ncbi:unnamed protein product [Somion occarium]|uniref:Mid2 domain-containing protein n=1 Tax=Somion occarium TaxID=3059160 RepID=A0ABP1CHC6_9APHY
MFVLKPRRIALTLFCSLAVLLALTSVAEANSLNAPQARDHVVLNRMMKKRAFPFLVDPAPDPPSDDPTPTSTGSTVSPTVSSVSSTVTSSVESSSVSETSSSVSASSVSSAAASSTASSVSSSASSSSVSESSSVATTSSSVETTSSASPTPTPTPTEAAVTSPPAETPATTDSFRPVSRVTSTVTDAAPSETSAAAQAAAAAASSSKVTKTTLIVIVSIAGSIGAIAIGWTIIRKVKFKPSAGFEDRMQPIDWQPTNGPDDRDDVPGVHRNASARSHGSFQSAGHSEENFAGRGMGPGYGGNGSDHGHGSSALQPIPDHDFTAGPSMAPVGGYADLARGTTPAPQMGELTRGPSVTRGYDAYGVPLHHQGAYDYNASAGVRY